MESPPARGDGEALDKLSIGTGDVGRHDVRDPVFMMVAMNSLVEIENGSVNTNAG